MLTRDPDVRPVGEGYEPSPLALFDVAAGYGRIEVIRDISVSVRRGTVTALLGPNGAGKTTTLGVMSGLLSPTSGCRHAAGHHVNGASASDLARIGICHLREGRSIFPNLTVADNLVVASSTGTPVDRLFDVAFTFFPSLGQRRSQLAGTLSGGEKQMLALSRGLGVDPSVLLIDELSMGLAPKIVEELFEAVAEVATKGVAVLVVEQFATIGLRFATHVYVMAHGRVTYDGGAAGASAAIERAYLGRGGDQP